MRECLGSAGRTRRASTIVAQDFFERQVILAALGAECEAVSDADEGFVERQSGELVFGELADVLETFAAIEFSISGESNHADESFNLL